MYVGHPLDQQREAMAARIYYEDTHQLVEGAGACPLAALLRERDALRGREVGLVLSGGNIDRPLYASIIGKDGA